MDSAKRMAASNAIVSVVGMYAGMLAEAEQDAERLAKACEQIADVNDRNVAEASSEAGRLRTALDLVVTESAAREARAQRLEHRLEAVASFIEDLVKYVLPAGARTDAEVLDRLRHDLPLAMKKIRDVE